MGASSLFIFKVELSIHTDCRRFPKHWFKDRRIRHHQSSVFWIQRGGRRRRRPVLCCTDLAVAAHRPRCRVIPNTRGFLLQRLCTQKGLSRACRSQLRLHIRPRRTVPGPGYLGDRRGTSGSAAKHPLHIGCRSRRRCRAPNGAEKGTAQ